MYLSGGRIGEDLLLLLTHRPPSLSLVLVAPTGFLGNAKAQVGVQVRSVCTHTQTTDDAVKIPTSSSTHIKLLKSPAQH